MFKKENFTPLILALLLYLPSCAYVPIWVFLILIAYSIQLNADFLFGFFKNLFQKKITDTKFLLLLALSAVALIFRLIDFNNWESYSDLYSFVYLFPFTYIVAKTVSLNRKVLDYLIYFVAFECGIGFVEYAFGVSTFYTGLKTYFVFPYDELQYFRRVCGLSPNSSSFAIKIFMTLYLLFVVDFSAKKKILFEFILITGLIATFGRMTLLALAMYLGLRVIKFILDKNKTKTSKLLMIPIISFFLFFAVNPKWTINQFIRNGMDWGGETEEVIESPKEVEDVFSPNDIGLSKLKMTGRKEIWSNYLNFSKENLTFGNFGKKYMLGDTHAHNSFLEILASFGIYFLGALLLIFGTSINKHNFIFIIPVILSSLTQYFIFWGISYGDVLFYFFLFFYMKPNEHKTDN